ncbi:MAG: hypothetical protein J6X45_03430 [Lachnospiraceae bacterium]|nr:hypothetical protein [Lachnospiraceae bacterium]
MNIKNHFLIYKTAKTVKKFCPSEWDDTGMDMDKVTTRLFKELLMLMFSAKACCHLENENEWSWTKDKQLEKLSSYEKRMQKVLQNII